MLVVQPCAECLQVAKHMDSGANSLGSSPSLALNWLCDHGLVP